MDDFKKRCFVGTTRYGRVFVDIAYNTDKDFDEKNLSITGNEGKDHCGQIVMSLRPNHFISFADGWDEEKVAKLLAVWERWHLNSIVPGTPAQMAIIRQKQVEIDLVDSLHREAPHAYASKMGFDSYYSMELSWLAAVGLSSDNGYRFGTKWLREEVPNDIIDWLKAL